MIVCDFCLQYKPDGTCGLGLNVAKRMSCREFGPGIEKFCSNPKDFVSPSQIIQMATFFGMKGAELKKVKLMAEREALKMKGTGWENDSRLSCLSDT